MENTGKIKSLATLEIDEEQGKNLNDTENKGKDYVQTGDHRPIEIDVIGKKIILKMSEIWGSLQIQQMFATISNVLITTHKP